mmetsp:Transcript_9782/g.17292  ORF Transcript_9782/g.17292 Transcript_9782/m.17292 type:complete len:607 (+) Transcript_9782:154-1974(+)
MRRNGGAPEVVPMDIEGGDGLSGKLTSLSRVPPPIQPFQLPPSTPKSRRGISISGNVSSSNSLDAEGAKNTGVLICMIWIGGCLLLGYDFLWPVYLVQNIIYSILSIPPLSWIFGWLYRGAPLVTGGVAEELTVAPNQVPHFIDSYVQQYGDAALIFASHDGYPQVLKGLLFNEELGYRDLVNARDDAGNTALIYAASKGFRQCTTALLRHGADPDEANEGGGGRTALMEAAGGGFRDIVMALRPAQNTTRSSINKQDDYGNTALHYAAYHGHLSTVLELLKSEPDKEIKNIYGHTPASYAAANRHKGVADLLNRPQSKAQRPKKEAETKEDTWTKRFTDQFEEQINKMKPVKEERHVHGVAETLHKRETDFAPTSDTAKISNTEQKALEEQLATLQRAHEESELKAQKRIVELLEKNAAHQTALDKALQEQRATSLNNTDMAFRIRELESKYRANELRVHEEAERVKSLREEGQNMKLEAEKHRRRAEAAEQERDHHMQASRHQEENVHRLQEEVRQHEERHERQQQEMTLLRERLQSAEKESRRFQDEIDRLQQELHQAGIPRSGQQETPLPVATSITREAAADGGSSGQESATEVSDAGHQEV